MPTAREQFEDALRKNAPAFAIQLGDDDVAQLAEYYQLLLKWNDRLHLVAPCSPEEFATRHVLESLLVLAHMRTGTKLLDVGSGAGLPAIPCFVVHPTLHGTLFESSKRKSAFLKEAFHHLDLVDRAQVIAARFEQTVTAPADFVTCRALDRFADMLPDLIAWAPPKAMLLLFAGEDLSAQIIKLLPSAQKERIPLSERRFLIKALRPSAH